MNPERFLEAGEDQVQQPILIDPDRRFVRHLLLHFPKNVSAEHFLSTILKDRVATVAQAREGHRLGVNPMLVNIGFTYRGLHRLGVPWYVLACFKQKAPAFSAGAPIRAAQFLGDTGASDPARWEHAFGVEHLHAVITLHGDDVDELEAETARIREVADCASERVDVTPSVRGHALTSPPREGLAGHDASGPVDPDATYVHFGFRDGLSQVGIRRWNEEPRADDPRAVEKISRHEIGEFVLGYQEDTTANPWIHGPDGRVLPTRLRDFFRNGSFGVLRKMAQHVDDFERFVQSQADALPDSIGLPAGDRVAYLKSKLCGRWPDGRRTTEAPWNRAADVDPVADFTYEKDQEGYGCPFGAHVRRMNPRGTPIAQQVTRPVMRRGMPYGPGDFTPGDQKERGLLGLFFCASIEDQFEHLLGQWGDRVPLGSPDTGDAKDPLVGDNRASARFVVPLPKPERAHVLDGLQSFVTTMGTAYLFYPSLSAVSRILGDDPWAAAKDLDP